MIYFTIKTRIIFFAIQITINWLTDTQKMYILPSVTVKQAILKQNNATIRSKYIIKNKWGKNTHTEKLPYLKHC